MILSITKLKSKILDKKTRFQMDDTIDDHAKDGGPGKV